MSHRKADNLLLFKSIVDAGSLSTAAKICNISISQVSKRMSYLESTLGLQLLQRTTRKLTLTAPGEALYQQLSSIKDQIDAAWESMLDFGKSPRGDLKISAPITYGTQQLIPMITSFKEEQPDINVVFELTNNEQPDELQSDLCFQSHIMDQHELLPDSNLNAKKVASERLLFVASRTYLQQHGHPTHPEALGAHKCLTLNSEKEWTFKKDGTTLTQALDTEFCANNFKSLHHAAVAGLGVARLPASLIRAEDNLVVLFEDYETKSLDTYAYVQPGKLASKKVELFLNKLKA